MKNVLKLLILSGCFIAVGTLKMFAVKAIYTENIYLCLYIDTSKNIWIHGFGDDHKELSTKDIKNLPADSTPIGKFTDRETTDLAQYTTTINIYQCTKQPTHSLPFYQIKNDTFFDAINNKEKAGPKNYTFVGNILVNKNFVSKAELETALKSPEKLAEEKKEAEEEKKRLATPTNYNAYFFLDSATKTLKVLYHIDGNTKSIRIKELPDFLKDQTLTTLGTYNVKFNDKKTVDDVLTTYVAIDFNNTPYGFGLTDITDFTMLTIKVERDFIIQNEAELTEAATKIFEKIEQEKLEKERIDIPKPPEKSDSRAIYNFAVVLSNLR